MIYKAQKIKIGNGLSIDKKILDAIKDASKFFEEEAKKRYNIHQDMYGYWNFGCITDFDNPTFDFTGYKSPIDGERMDIDGSNCNQDPFGIQSAKENLTTPQKMIIYRYHIMCGRCLKHYTKIID